MSLAYSGRQTPRDAYGEKPVNPPGNVYTYVSYLYILLLYKNISLFTIKYYLVLRKSKQP